MAGWTRRAPGEAGLSPHDRKLLFIESFFGNFLFSICMLFGEAMTSALALAGLCRLRAGRQMPTAPPDQPALRWPDYAGR